MAPENSDWEALSLHQCKHLNTTFYIFSLWSHKTKFFFQSFPFGIYFSFTHITGARGKKDLFLVVSLERYFQIYFHSKYWTVSYWKGMVVKCHSFFQEKNVWFRSMSSPPCSVSATILGPTLFTSQHPWPFWCWCIFPWAWCLRPGGDHCPSNPNIFI